ncbi:peptidoglycan-binding domain-containing protein [Afipia sp. TerB]
MPRKTAEKPRRRAAAAVAIERDPNPVMRVLLHSPKDTLAGFVAFAAVMAIIVNATFLQAGRHPYPMFGMALTSPAPVSTSITVMPRARPVDPSPREETRPRDPQPQAAAAPVKAAPAPVASAHHRDPLGDLINSNRRIAAVQRALTEYGYGQLKADGAIGPETQAAIRKFEIDRKRAPTGAMSDWLVQQVVILTGRPID